MKLSSRHHGRIRFSRTSLFAHARLDTVMVCSRKTPRPIAWAAWMRFMTNLVPMPDLAGMVSICTMSKSRRSFSRLGTDEARNMTLTLPMPTSLYLFAGPMSASTL